jgi:DNA-binding transcriptional LysR family regulator
MSIDLRLLRHAQALALHRSFSRAAEELGIAQPSLSRGIKELEALVGLPLFQRSRSGHEPTDFGRVFLQHAADVLAQADDLEREVALAKGLGTGELAIGFGFYAADVLGPHCAARFAADHPGVRLRVSMNDPASVVRALRARTVDLAVAAGSMLESSALEDGSLEIVDRLSPLDGYVIVRVGHPLTRKTKSGIADVLDHPFAQVMMLTPRMLKPMLAARRTTPDPGGSAMPVFPAIECPTIGFAAKFVAKSDAFTFASLGLVQPELESGQLVPVLAAPWLRVEWVVLRLRNRTPSPASVAFVEELRLTHAEVLREEAELRERWFAPREVPASKPT